MVSAMRRAQATPMMWLGVAQHMGCTLLKTGSSQFLWKSAKKGDSNIFAVTKSGVSFGVFTNLDFGEAPETLRGNTNSGPAGCIVRAVE